MVFGGHRHRPVDQQCFLSAGETLPAAPADDQVRADTVKPTRDVVGHVLAAHVPNESNERLLDQIVRGVMIADRGEDKGLELRGMSVERRFDDRAKHRRRRRHSGGRDPARNHWGVRIFDIWSIDVWAAEVFHGTAPPPVDRSRTRQSVVRLRPIPTPVDHHPGHQEHDVIGAGLLRHGP